MLRLAGFRDQRRETRGPASTSNAKASYWFVPARSRWIAHGCRTRPLLDSVIIVQPMNHSLPALPVHPRHSFYFSRDALKRAGLRLARCWRAVEERSLGRLQSKVATKRRAGWVADGDPVQVTHYSRKRARSRFSQLMFLPLRPAM